MSEAVARVGDTVEIGDLFIRLTKGVPMWKPGDVAQVYGTTITGEDAGFAFVASEGHGERWSVSELLNTPDFKRAPTVADCLASMRRLVASYHKMRADPETGRHGIDATVREMAALCGLEVT
jgi:hypothetical protein